MFAGRDDLLIPRIYHEYSSPKVLVMERMRGVMISDAKGIQAMGLKLSDVSQVVAEVFSESQTASNSHTTAVDGLTRS